MVGRQHCNVKTLSFNAARWLSFKNAMLNTFAKDEKNKAFQPWSILIGFIIYEIKDAYLAHVSRRNEFFEKMTLGQKEADSGRDRTGDLECVRLT